MTSVSASTLACSCPLGLSDDLQKSLQGANPSRRISFKSSTGPYNFCRFVDFLEGL
ncbi:hypothetical protein PF005_g2434 [Phytophthora fragariae]|uniref:Uncharacterized protein n=1 Tax=Phytophthora fragariae TaxID=53985 RepID=A0A6A3UUP0_9STRA|nr:hypothetical protein PF003_g8526 [Phytophthora fragariae]KAE8946076.1 hypothetical protein PF009_g4294 [Phytophthora fragariae]KAE9025119.1 hypothetical protein PF011_g3189 [Phytophthora fragariae]KAE9135612.1 hypothetical protein PF010_g2015 [Phytophthora fragariae]KAE9135922.1 hypothetical protein PF007_g2379 [Phytophthora fragariae]